VWGKNGNPVVVVVVGSAYGTWTNYARATICPPEETWLVSRFSYTLFVSGSFLFVSGLF
jgi:hypothetical protein